MDTVEITLPVSKKIAVIRNFTTRADDQNAASVLRTGVYSEQINNPDGTTTTSLRIPQENIAAANESYIPRLVQTIDGATATNKAIAELRTEDYEVLEKAVNDIVAEHSPKVTRDSAPSVTATIEK